uniref:NADH dehydrogenase subunit 2 n=1 Tax=Oecleopsis sinicus TaxID=1308491 RepID=UPI0021B670A0|nr:NADH dehydrogenase subunit 2 [Oecleopsis sinicus]UVV36475.1 NADH dehydrogenase subunit 2 [Oecleopsis sinicus]
MKFNLSTIMLTLMIILSTLISLNSNNWMTMWMTLEMNMFMFVPIMTSKNKMSDQPMKYLIIQSISSSIMLMSIISSSINDLNLKNSILLMTALSIKMGMAPFHLWVPSIMAKLNWNKCIILTTLLKMSPMMISSQLIELKTFFMPMILSTIMGSTMGIKQTSLKKIMAYSSISNSTWMLLSFMMSKSIMILFSITYSLINILIMTSLKKLSIMYINQMSNMKTKENINLILLMLSISGLPPTIGFFPKWMILKELINLSIVLSSVLIFSSIISMYFYLQMITSNLTMFSLKKKFMKKNKTISFMTINMMGIMMFFLIKSI